MKFEVRLHSVEKLIIIDQHLTLCDIECQYLTLLVVTYTRKKKKKKKKKKDKQIG